jgi:hypothetical protein
VLQYIFGGAVTLGPSVFVTGVAVYGINESEKQMKALAAAKNQTLEDDKDIERIVVTEEFDTSVIRKSKGRGSGN